jgi:hypothetical protein
MNKRNPVNNSYNPYQLTCQHNGEESQGDAVKPTSETYKKCTSKAESPT